MRHARGGLVGLEMEPALRAADTLEFKEVVPGVRKATLWGDDAKGPYGAFTKFAAGHKNALHTHENDIKLAVIRGAYIYTGEDGKETRLGPGSYAMVPAGHKHASAGDPDEETLFFELGGGRFSLDFVGPEAAEPKKGSRRHSRRH